jgi:hypothetical protein
VDGAAAMLAASRSQWALLGCRARRRSRSIATPRRSLSAPARSGPADAAPGAPQRHCERAFAFRLNVAKRVGSTSAQVPLLDVPLVQAAQNGVPVPMTAGDTIDLRPPMEPVSITRGTLPMARTQSARAAVAEAATGTGREKNRLPVVLTAADHGGTVGPPARPPPSGLLRPVG